MRIPDWAGDVSAPASHSLPLCPNGTHTGEIVGVKVKNLSFMAGVGNEVGESLEVTVSISNYQPVESLIATHWRGKFEAAARAAGVSMPVPGQEWDEQAMLGRTVTIETEIGARNGGGERVNVKRWLPSPSKRVAPPQSPPAASARRAAPQPAGDDIPFALLLAIASLLGGMA